MLNNLSVIDKNDILTEAAKLKQKGYRLVTITCEKDGDAYEFIYHFDLNYIMKNIEFTTDKKEGLKSISSVYPSAFLIENEYQDLFGVTFEGLSIDYKGRLYLTEDGPKSPLA
ncbi:MAG: NADH-quinone oxidoreductase subunit C [Clostridiales bacterium]|nr:NADH-quinone oxidoreductase subunit C [Clostridiales bacterium]